MIAVQPPKFRVELSSQLARIADTVPRMCLEQADRIAATVILSDMPAPAISASPDGCSVILDWGDMQVAATGTDAVVTYAGTSITHNDLGAVTRVIAHLAAAR